MNNESYRICRLRAADGGARVLLEIEALSAEEASRETLCLLVARLSKMPTLGEISPETVCEMRREHQICAAIDTGLRMLVSSGCSTKHLIDKLRLRGVDANVAREAAEVLREKGYLREEEGALREAERGLAKLWGDRRILADLSAKGYQGSALKYAAARLRTENGAARCALLMRKRRIGTPTNEAEARRIFACLTRYGYTSAEIHAAMDQK